MYFVLSYKDYGIDLFNELGEPHTRSLRDLNTMNIKKREKLTGKKQFSKVICQSEMDFIFPAPEITQS